MIAGIFHQGSGLGNQLHRYVATRVLALDKGYRWGMMYKHDGSGKEEGFKGKSFMNLDLGWETNVLQTRANNWLENTNYYNPEWNFIEDNTIIDGEFQDPRYFEHRMKEVDEWLKVEPIDIPDDLCVIGFRGGEYYMFPDLGLPLDYFNEGIERMLKINPKMRFQVHTDDPATAQLFFPGYEIIHGIGINWRSMRYAKHAIIANSSFYILPRLLNGGITIAPRFWARRNIKVWAMPQNYYKQFLYI